MYTIAIVTVLFLSGCSNFTVNATMCEKIANEPGATVPQECKNYDKKRAAKAFNKVIDEKKVSDKDLKFKKDDE